MLLMARFPWFGSSWLYQSEGCMWLTGIKFDVVFFVFLIPFTLLAKLAKNCLYMDYKMFCWSKRHSDHVASHHSMIAKIILFHEDIVMF